MRPLVRQLADVGPVEALPAGLPMTIEENGFHFRRVGADGLPARDGGAGALRWDGPARGARRSRRGLARAARAPLSRGGRRAAPPRLGRLLRHDAGRASDHRRVADGVYAACGFSGHGFMQSPAVGDAVAAELLGEEPPFDLSPYRLERFAGDAIFPETLVL